MVPFLGLAALAALTAAPVAPPGQRARPAPLTFESARQMPPRDLERRIAGELGTRFAVVGIEQSGNSIIAGLRSHAVKQDQVCMASQIDLRLDPEPTFAPKGTVPGAIHVSRLPMLAMAVRAKQVYRLGPPSLAGWHPPMSPDPCDSVDPHLNFVEAPSATEAAVALRALAQVLDAVRTGRPDFIVQCDGAGDTKCLETVAGLDPEAVTNARGSLSIALGFRPFDRRKGYAYRLSIELSSTGSTARPTILRIRLDTVAPPVV